MAVYDRELHGSYGNYDPNKNTKHETLLTIMLLYNGLKKQLKDSKIIIDSTKLF